MKKILTTLSILIISITSFSQDEINRFLKKGEEVYEEYYTYQGCYNKIINKLKN
jgi:hypothetical protein